MLYQAGSYQVKKSGVEKVKKAIAEFVDYVKIHEPGSLMTPELVGGEAVFTDCEMIAGKR